MQISRMFMEQHAARDLSVGKPWPGDLPFPVTLQLGVFLFVTFLRGEESDLHIGWSVQVTDGRSWWENSMNDLSLFSLKWWFCYRFYRGTSPCKPPFFLLPTVVHHHEKNTIWGICLTFYLQTPKKQIKDDERPVDPDDLLDSYRGYIRSSKSLPPRKSAIWRCISYWIWGYSNVMLVFRGVDVQWGFPSKSWEEFIDQM